MINLKNSLVCHGFRLMAKSRQNPSNNSLKIIKKDFMKREALQ